MQGHLGYTVRVGSELTHGTVTCPCAGAPVVTAVLVPTDFLDEQEVEVVVTVDGVDAEGAQQQQGAQREAVVEVEVAGIAAVGQEAQEWDGGARTWHVVAEVSTI